MFQHKWIAGRTSRLEPDRPMSQSTLPSTNYMILGKCHCPSLKNGAIILFLGRTHNKLTAHSDQNVLSSSTFAPFISISKYHLFSLGLEILSKGDNANDT